MTESQFMEHIHTEPRVQPARYYMIGGFLGAGKTTALAALAKRLSAQQLRVGLITNDQAGGLVDTATLRARGFATEEIAGGCFCCRFQSLVDAARKLDATSRPDAFVAEPVGSCTDLIATVSYPLRRIYGRDFELAPLSVLIDPLRAEQILEIGEPAGRRFSEKVRYIWKKQAEEADVLVLSKADLLDGRRLEQIQTALLSAFPGKPLFSVSVRDDLGCEAWFEYLETQSPTVRSVMEVDYDMYAEGEALLGWLNATLKVTGSAAFDANDCLKQLAVSIRDALGEAEIAHLKMTFSPTEGLGDISAISLVRSDFIPELTLTLEDPVAGGELVINARAEVGPNELRDAVESAVESFAQKKGLDVVWEHLESFKPGRPVPTHRMNQQDVLKL